LNHKPYFLYIISSTLHKDINYYFEKIRTKTADSQEVKLGIQLKAEKPLALISEKEYENILKFLQKGK